VARGPESADKLACRRVRETLDAFQLQLMRRDGRLCDLAQARSDLVDAVRAAVRAELLPDYDKVVSGG
jgi:hypothetical protein